MSVYTCLLTLAVIRSHPSGRSDGDGQVVHFLSDCHIEKSRTASVSSLHRGVDMDLSSTYSVGISREIPR